MADIYATIEAANQINASVEENSINVTIEGSSAYRTFKALMDTPEDIEALKIIRGNAAGDALEFTEVSGGSWGEIDGTLSDQIDLQSALDLKEEDLTFSTGLTRTANTITVNNSELALTASQISIVDTNDYYLSTEIEGVLDEIGETRAINGYDLTVIESLPDLDFNTTTRVFTTSVKGGSSDYYFWVDSKKFTKTGDETVTLPDITDTYYIYFDNTGALKYVAQSGLNPEQFYENAITGLVYWNKTAGSAIVGNELHGKLMDARTHNYNHSTFGARYESGLDITGLSDGGSTYTNHTSGFFWDEDIRHVIDLQDSAPFIYRLGTSGEWTGTTPDNEISYTEGGSYYVWNEWTGTTWQLTEGGSSTAFWIIFTIATPDLAGNPVKKIIGQNAYPNRASARAALYTEINDLVTKGLPSPEFVFLQAWITKRDGTLEDDGNGNTYIDLRTYKGGTGSTSGSTSLASDVVTDTSLFNTHLSSSDITVQSALDTLDDHTHTASQISDFDAEVSNNTSVSENTAKETNATHTGEVTGNIALTLDKTAISNKNIVTAVGSDYVIIEDTSDTGNLKRALISDFASAGGDMAQSTYDQANIAEQLVGLVAEQTLTNKTLTTPIISSISNTGTITLPTDTDTLIGKATTDTLTNKTFDANGTGNSILNIDVEDLSDGTSGELITWSATGVPTTVEVGTATHVLTSNGVGAAPTFQAAASGFTDPMTTRGDIIYKDSSNVTNRLGVGTIGQVISSDGTDASWSSLVTNDITESTDKNYVTDAEKVVIENTTGINTGDQSLDNYFETTVDNMDDITNGTTYVKTENNLTDAYITVLDNTSGTNTGDTSEFFDNVFKIKDNTDSTKIIDIDASGIATLTTRTIIMPDANVDLGNIGLNTTHRTSDGTNHSNVVLNDTHRGLVSGNPHVVTKTEVGLSNVPNTDCTNASNISSGTLASSVLPPVALTTVQVAVDETAQLALTAEEGDVVVRSDENKSYMHNGGSAGTMADWTELQTPTDSVLSVNGETGTVVITTGDIGVDVDSNYVTDAQLTVIGDTSGTNTGDEITGNLTETTSSVLTITNGTDSVIGAGTTIEVDQADTTNDGYLSSTDWNTFNNKVSNVTTDLSAGTRTATTINVNSSDGTNATLVEADTTNAGILGSDKWDEIVANTLAKHAESHTVASHSDTTATGAELNTLTGGGNTTLHSHDGISENTTHRTSDGSDHSFIGQDVTSASAPTFTGTNFTGIPGSGITDDSITEAKLDISNIPTDGYYLQYKDATDKLTWASGGSGTVTSITAGDGLDFTDITTTGPVTLGTPTTLTNSTTNTVTTTSHTHDITTANLTESTSSILTITGGTDSLLGTGTTIEVSQSNTNTSGYLSSTDWNTFNGKGDMSDLVDDTSPQLGGNLSLNQHNINYDPTPTVDHTYNGEIINGTPGESVVIGDVCYLKSDGKFWKIDADAEATTKGLCAMVTETISADGEGTFLLKGFIRDDTWTWTIGAELFGSTTPGNPTETKPSATGDIVRLMGYAFSADVIYFNPDQTYIEIA